MDFNRSLFVKYIILYHNCQVCSLPAVSIYCRHCRQTARPTFTHRKRELTLHEMSVPFYIVFQNCFPDFLQIFDLRIQRYSQLSGISEIDIYLFIAEHVGRYQPRLIELVIDEHL